MNYFAHGIRFLQRPYFLAGTAVPDWLAVADRRVRLRPRRVEPFADGSGSIQDDVAAGVLRHFQDDLRFHRARSFVETSAELSGRFRRVLRAEDGHRTGLLGHIVTEMILDGVLVRTYPTLLDEYYAILSQIDAAAVEQAVNRMAKTATSRLAVWIPLFCREQFLRDYCDPASLRGRLNQVMRRVKLNPLPETIEGALAEGWAMIESRMGQLLPDLPFASFSTRTSLTTRKGTSP